MTRSTSLDTSVAPSQAGVRHGQCQQAGRLHSLHLPEKYLAENPCIYLCACQCVDAELYPFGLVSCPAETQSHCSIHHCLSKFHGRMSLPRKGQSAQLALTCWASWSCACSETAESTSLVACRAQGHEQALLHIAGGWNSGF